MPTENQKTIQKVIQEALNQARKFYGQDFRVSLRLEFTSTNKAGGDYLYQNGVHIFNMNPKLIEGDTAEEIEKFEEIRDGHIYVLVSEFISKMLYGRFLYHGFEFRSVLWYCFGKISHSDDIETLQHSEFNGLLFEYKCDCKHGVHYIGQVMHNRIQEDENKWKYKCEDIASPTNLFRKKDWTGISINPSQNKVETEAQKELRRFIGEMASCYSQAVMNFETLEERIAGVESSSFSDKVKAAVKGQIIRFYQNLEAEKLASEFEE